MTVVGLGALMAGGCHAPTQRLHISAQSAVSGADEFAARRGIVLLRPDERALLAYAPSSESFELYVPAGTEATLEEVGLVWVSPSQSGAPRRDWAAALDRHRVLWIGANAAGNRRSPPDRIHLALDAAHHIRGLLRSEHPRIFVGGFSGGARIASEAALLYPDVFFGALLAGAADYFRHVKSSDPRWTVWEPTFPPPLSDLLSLAKTRGRYVFLTGSRDVNSALVRDVSQAYVADGFPFVRLLDIPKLGHELPPPECFERALAELLVVSSTTRVEPITNCD